MANSHRIETRSRQSHAHLFCAAFMMVALATTTSSQPAASQQNPAAAPRLAGTEIAPRGQHEAKDIVYGDWKKLCFKPGAAKTICRTSITGTFPTGQVAVRVDIVKRDGDGNARLQVFSPVGMYLPKPVRFTIDQGASHSVPYTWCLTNACIAAAAADPNMIEEMATGQTLRLEFVDSSLLTLTTLLPLGQFAPAHNGAPAQTFEQDIDE
jgi:invasion protein IalB